jgi:hypothetical protein
MYAAAKIIHTCLRRKQIHGVHHVLNHAMYFLTDMWAYICARPRMPVDDCTRLRQRLSFLLSVHLELGGSMLYMRVAQLRF